jgi:hypothetical protein
MKKYDMLKVLENSVKQREERMVYEVFDIGEEDWFKTWEEVRKDYPDPRMLLDKFDLELVVSINLASDSYSEAIALLLLKSGKRYATIRDILEAFFCVFWTRERIKEGILRFNAWLKKEIEEMNFPYG